MMQLVDDARRAISDALDKWRKCYDAGIERTRDDCCALLKPRVTATDRKHAKNIAREAYVAVCERFGSHHRIHIQIELADGSIVRWRDLKNQPKAGNGFDWEAARQQCPTRQRLQEERESLPVWKRGDVPAR